MNERIIASIWRLGLILFCIAGVCPPLAYAGGPFRGTDVPYDYIQCTIDAVTGGFSEAQSNYTVQGNCQVYTKNPEPKGGSTFPVLSDAFIWTAAGTYQPGKYYTTETISVRRPNSGQFTTPVIATIVSTMFCKQDPWLQPDGLSCGSVRYQQAGTLGVSYGDQQVQAYLYGTNPVVPRSSMLSPQQRATLAQEYQRSLVSTLKNKPAAIPLKPPAAASASPSGLAGANRVAALIAPMIVSPSANSHVGEGNFQLKATIAGSYTGAEGVYAQFIWVDTPASYNPHPYVNTWPISLKDLLNGIAVPNYITRNQYGRWQARAQIASPTAGPWSAAVPFYLDKIILKRLR